MKFDSYTRFLKSLLYQECMLAEVEGRPLPDPYHIPSSPTSKNSTTGSDRSNLSTPKKVRKHKDIKTFKLCTVLVKHNNRDHKEKLHFLIPNLCYGEPESACTCRRCDERARLCFSAVSQEDKKSKSGRSLNEDSRDDSGGQRKGMFFSWTRNRSFGKGPKKRELADLNYSQ